MERTLRDILQERETVLIRYKLSCERDMSLRVRLEQLDKELQETKEKAGV